MSDRSRFIIALVILFVALVAMTVVSLSLGSTRVDPSRVFLEGSVDAVIVFDIRLPRTLAAIVAGAAFSVAGLLIQTASSNALASPNIIGVNSGAGFAVLVFLAFFPQLYHLLPLAAFLGALVAVSLVFLRSSTTRRIPSTSSLILSGIAVNALFNALISTLASLEPDVMGTYSAFSVGGFASVDMDQLAPAAILIVLSIAAVFPLSRIMDIARLSDEIASSLGYRPQRIRILLMALACLMAASAVSFAGLLGFVGLVVPHVASFLCPGGSRRTLTLSLLAGPLLVLVADFLGRMVMRPSELPAGVFMVLVGVPFFIFLLTRRSRS